MAPAPPGAEGPLELEVLAPLAPPAFWRAVAEYDAPALAARSCPRTPCSERAQYKRVLEYLSRYGIR